MSQSQAINRPSRPAAAPGLRRRPRRRAPPATASSAAQAAARWEIHSLANTTVAPGGVIRYHVLVRDIGDVPAPATTGGDANNCVAGSPPPSDPAKCVKVTADFPPQLTPLGADTQGGPCARCRPRASSAPIRAAPRPPNSKPSPASTASSSAPASNPAQPPPAPSPAPSRSPAAKSPTLGNGRPDPGQRQPAPLRHRRLRHPGHRRSRRRPPDPGRRPPLPAPRPTSLSTPLTTPAPVGGDLYPVESTRDVLVDLPAGFVGDPAAAERCTAASSRTALSFTPLRCARRLAGRHVAVFLSGPTRSAPMFGPLPGLQRGPAARRRRRASASTSLGTVVTLDAEPAQRRRLRMRATAQRPRPRACGSRARPHVLGRALRPRATTPNGPARATCLRSRRRDHAARAARRHGVPAQSDLLHRARRVQAC